ncbi:protachykinin [Channa argus]|uniref:protachykinin n=1 Tax=Channa argus TaxID=215402 RepID=UPI003521363B
MMEMVKLVVILVLLLENVFCQEKDVGTWREGGEQNKWTNSEVIRDILVRMARKPGARRHVGLTGRKISAKTQRARKWHKFQTFVGLMGKRSFEDQGAPSAAQRTGDY